VPWTVRLLLTAALTVLTVPPTVATPVTPSVLVWIAEVTVVPTVKDETDKVLVARPGETLTTEAPFVMSGVDIEVKPLIIGATIAPAVVKLEARSGPLTRVLLPPVVVMLMPSLMESPRSIVLPVSSEVILLLWSCRRPG
jgi:hypothetical protein